MDSNGSHDTTTAAPATTTGGLAVGAAPTGRPIRVILQQPALPQYRVPVFRELAKRPGIDLTVLYGDVPGLANAEPDGFRAFHSPAREFGSGRMQLVWHAEQRRYADPAHADVLCMAWNLHYASLVPALVKAKALGVPTILWGHGYSKREGRLRARLRNRAGYLATALLFYNHTVARSMIETGVPADRVFVAINSLDQSPIQVARQSWLNRPADLAAFKAEHGLTDGPVLLFVSRLERDNRVDLLLSAAANLRSRFPTLKVVIIGRGEEADRLTEMARQPALAGHVIMPGPIYDEAAIAPWFLSADVFCYPANIGLSILHAFGYGVPVVTGNRVESQNPEIEALEPGHNGLLFHDGDAADLSRVLAELLCDRARLSRMSAAASETVRHRFSLKRMLDGFETAIRYCVANARSVPRT